MTLIELRMLCQDAMTSAPHMDQFVTLENLRYLTMPEREQAAKCYAAIIGERTIPIRKSARREIENRRDMT